MSYNDYEVSPYSSTPQRLFLFQSGNQQWPLVNTSKSIVRGALTYEPEIISMGNIVQNLGEGPPVVEIAISSSAAVVQPFVPYQPIFPLLVTVYKRHRDDPASEYIVEFIGEVAGTSIDEEEGMATFQCRMTTSNVSRKVPLQIYQPLCNWVLYGPGCQVNKEDYKVETPVSDVNLDALVSSDFATKPDGWFTNGFVRRDLTGEVRFIVAHVGNTIWLQTPFVDMDTGDVVSAFAGCDRTRATCNTKFANLRRHLAFPWLPYKNPFTDNVYGTGTPGSSGGGSVAGAIINKFKTAGG